MKSKYIVKNLCKVLLGVLGAVLICINLLWHIDTMKLWSVLPGVGSSREMQESAYAMVTIIEKLPEDEYDRRVPASMTLFAAVAYADKTAQSGNPDDQIMSQYALGLVRGGLLEAEGKLSMLEYQLLKLPFKTGNTSIMKQMLPVLQRKTSLPEVFMSEEYLNEQNKQAQAEQAELREYKEKNVYGRYYLYGNFSEYLEVTAASSGSRDLIRFGTNSGRHTDIKEQSFRYKKGENAYETDDGLTEFQWSEADVIEVTKGGMISPSTYIKPNSSDFVFPDSSERKLTEGEVQALSDSRRRIAKNEIYARHSYPFESEDLREYFGQCRWYKRGEFEPDEFYEGTFSEVERYNLELLR